MPKFVLASTSRYRRSLLARLGLPFETAAPRTDETPLPDEAPELLVTRLAEAKARAVAADYPKALIVGSDQVAVLDGSILGKPGNHADAVAQLSAARGRRVRFLTGLCLLDTRHNRSRCSAVPFDVVFRQLTDEQIEHYLRHEQPYDCAGSFKSEGLGIALFERLEGDDPSALMGLPLITLTEMLTAAGIDVLTESPAI